MFVKRSYPIPIYEKGLTIIWTDDYDVNKHSKRFNIDGTGIPGMTIYTDLHVTIVLTNAMDVPDMAHEALHAVHSVWRMIHKEVHIDDDEPDAYLIGFIMEKIIDTYIIFRKKR